ncbi:MAG: Flp pilus assembly protein CpaB [Actinobacteria bacterium]|nr:Flp pilus assembly protein CpaB [Actinomycetota bacterium]
MKRRIVGVATAIAMAAAGTFVIVAYVGSAEDRALAGQRTVDVLVAAKPIEKGTAADDLGDLVKTERIPAKVRAQDAVGDLADLGDRVAAVSFSAGEQLTASRFVKPGDLALAGQVEVPDGLLQVTLALSPERAVGGLIEPGSTVAVLGSFEPFDIATDQPVDVDGTVVPPGGKTPNSTHIIKQKALVTSVQQSDAVASSDTDENQAPKGNVYVTLALTGPEVEQVVFSAEHGTVWLAFEPEDAPTDDHVVTRANVYQ